MIVQLFLVLISQSLRAYRMQFYDLMVENRQLSLQSPYLVRYELFAAIKNYQGADKFLARPGRKQATATADFEFHISYL